MKNKLITYLAGLTLPLAFAIPVNPQEFELQKINTKNIESFFVSENIPQAPQAYEVIQENKSKISRETYNINMCPKADYNLGKLIITYEMFKKQWNRPYFSVKSIFGNNDTDYSGVFSIVTATNTVHTNPNNLNKYHLESTNKDKTIKRKYDFRLNKLHEEGCVDATIFYEEEKKTSFGDFLPGK